MTRPTTLRPILRSVPGILARISAALLILAGCETTSQKGATSSGDDRISSNTLAAGDVITVAYPSAAELNQTQKIRLDGKVSLPMVGEVSAVGKSPKGLQDELAGKYAEFLQDPKVIVSLESSVAVVYVNGEVRAPGKVSLERPMTVFEAIMESGGFSPLANSGKVILTRPEGGKLQRHVLNLKKDSDDAVFLVKPFDTITVSQSWF